MIRRLERLADPLMYLVLAAAFYLWMALPSGHRRGPLHWLWWRLLPLAGFYAHAGLLNWRWSERVR